MEKEIMNKSLPCSFRDPSGFIFLQNGVIYRHVNYTYKENYDYLVNSGLYKNLTADELLIQHEEINRNNLLNFDKAYKILRPDVIPFISYPYEWCFSQLKDAALITLEIQKRALQFGMSLKDASAYNIQFIKGKPKLIDTLSFEKYSKGAPWVAYKQFCQHYLAPLVLMIYIDIRLNQLLRVYIDGIPLSLASSLLKARSYLNFPVLLHIHLHARSQSHFADKSRVEINRQFSLLSFQGLIDSLESYIRKLRWKHKTTEWSDYYKGDSYDLEALEHKKQLVSEFLDKINPKVVWDMGANTGLFSHIAKSKGAEEIISFDVDPACVEINYLNCKKNGETHILPLLFDLTNPSPAIGWENQERKSLLERSQADTVFALALIHHLAISNNLPLNKIAEFFKKICQWLIIEFVPKDDIKVQKLLTIREDIFPTYTQESFESEFNKLFTIYTSVKIKNSQRILYLMKRK